MLVSDTDSFSSIIKSIDTINTEMTGLANQYAQANTNDAKNLQSEMSWSPNYPICGQNGCSQFQTIMNTDYYQQPVQKIGTGKYTYGKLYQNSYNSTSSIQASLVALNNLCMHYPINVPVNFLEWWMTNEKAVTELTQNLSYGADIDHQSGDCPNAGSCDLVHRQINFLVNTWNTGQTASSKSVSEFLTELVKNAGTTQPTTKGAHS